MYGEAKRVLLLASKRPNLSNPMWSETEHGVWLWLQESASKMPHHCERSNHHSLMGGIFEADVYTLLYIPHVPLRSTWGY